MDQIRLAEPSASPRSLPCEEVTLKGLPATDLAAAGYLESLRCPPVGLQLGHGLLLHRLLDDFSCSTFRVWPRGKNHGHVPPFDLRGLLYLAHVLQGFGQTI